MERFRILLRAGENEQKFTRDVKRRADVDASVDQKMGTKRVYFADDDSFFNGAVFETSVRDERTRVVHPERRSDARVAQIADISIRV